MHKKINNNLSKNFIQGLRPLANTLPTQIKKILKKNGFNLSSIVDNWTRIVSKDVSDNCYPINIKVTPNSKNLILGDGNINSSIMLISEAPAGEGDDSGLAFRGDVGELLKKMLLAIQIKLEDTYIAYSINFRTPEDRKPTSQEIKRYSTFLKEHISIINPKILILMGSTAMEAVTGLSNKISNERGNWKEIILKNKTYPIMITFSPSYLIRFPENKKHSWEDLKKIRQKIKDLNIKI